MKRLVIILLFPSFIYAQVNPVFIHKTGISTTRLENSGEGMFGFEQADKYGYLDKNGTVVIQPIYSYENLSYKSIPGFLNGYAKARKDNKWGLIDKNGKELLPFEFENLNVYTMSKGLIAASKKENSKTVHGVINLQNKVIVPFEYEDITLDSNLIVVKQNGKWGLFDNTGKKLLPAEYTSLIAFKKPQLLKAEKDGKLGFIDPTGKWVFEKAKSVYTLYGPVEGMILCIVSSKYGFLDLKGNEVIMTKYDQGYGFEDIGLAKVGRKISSSSYSYHYGYIDKKGTEIIPLKYETIGSFSNGLVYAKEPETNRYGFLDKTGKWVIKPQYLEVTSFDVTGGAWVKMTDGKYHYISKAGKDLGVLEEEAKTPYYRSFFGGYAVVENADYPYVLVDATGKMVRKLDDVDNIYSYSGGYAGYKCKSNGLYGFVDVNGNKVIPCDYTGFTGFVDGISKVDKKIDGKTKSGYINTKGEIIVPIEHEWLTSFRNGWGLLKKDGNFFFVDAKGNLREPARKYDELYEFRSGFSLGIVKPAAGDKTYYYINDQLKEAFSITVPEAYTIWDEVAIVSRGNGYELMNKKGEIFKTLTGIDQLKFSNDGMLAVKEKGKWGFIDDKGNSIVPAKYDSTESYRFGYGKVKMANKWGIVDKSGKEIIAPRYENIYIGENGIFIYYNAGWGIIDKNEKIITPPHFNYLTTFEKDRALARMGKSYTILKSPLLK